MTSPTIIALIGPKGCGKSTLADAAAERFDLIRLPFAGPLKSMLWHYLTDQHLDANTATRMVYGDLKELPTEYFDGHTTRYAMQTLGTEWRDLISKTLWTNAWKRRIERSQESRFIVDDMRYLHEAEAVRSLGGHIFRIHREGQEPSTDPHPSEREWLSIEPDSMIVNYPDRPEAMLTQLIDFLPNLRTL